MPFGLLFFVVLIVGIVIMAAADAWDTFGDF